MVGDRLEKRKVVHKYARTKARQRGQPTARKKGKASAARDSNYEMATRTLLRSYLSYGSRSRLGPGQAVDQAGRSSGGILPPATSPVLSRLALRAGGLCARSSPHIGRTLRIRRGRSLPARRARRPPKLDRPPPRMGGGSIFLPILSISSPN